LAYKDKRSVSFVPQSSWIDRGHRSVGNVGRGVINDTSCKNSEEIQGAVQLKALLQKGFDRKGNGTNTIKIVAEKYGRYK
jgi:serine kinase of HPr protein (carbohydrate metabolism regulator)